MRSTTLILMFACLACGGSGQPTPPEGAAATPAPPASAPSITGTATIDPAHAEEWQLVAEITRQFWSGDLAALHARFSPGMREEWTLDKLREFRDQTVADLGNEQETVAATREERGGYRAFKRAVRFSRHDRLVEVAWVLDGQDAVAGLVITPARS